RCSPANEERIIPPSSGTYTFTVSCDGVLHDSAVIHVGDLPTPPPTPPPPPTRSKLTIHTAFCNGFGESGQFIQAAQPGFVKVLNEVGWVKQIKSVSPNTRVIARLFIPNQPAGKEWDEADARAQAQLWWNQFGNTILNNPDVDYWEGLNEPGVGSEGAMVWYNAFEVRRVEILAQHGRKACIGNFSQGTPDVTNPAIIQRFYEAIDAAMAHGGILGLHEYDAPSMIGDGWHTLRYRKLYNQYLIPTNRVINAVITECGIDGGVIGHGGGWKDFTNAQDYVEQLKWYDDNLRQDAYVLGATIFCIEMLGGWGSFDICGEARVLLQNYCRQSK
ncbi:MAG: hypothetical protein JW881_08380, partial [Spirochaetales bacterium]|nr:hypothetical protein [Spirochaetales bacterium]